MAYPVGWFWAATAAAAALKAGCGGHPGAPLGSNPAAACNPEKAEKAEGGNCNGNPFLSNIFVQKFRETARCLPMKFKIF